MMRRRGNRGEVSVGGGRYGGKGRTELIKGGKRKGRDEKRKGRRGGKSSLTDSDPL